MQKEQKNHLEIELPEEVAQGDYTNLAIISHSPSEFVIDFVKIVPGLPKAKVVSRMILAPDRAKALLLALKDNIDKYEKAFGAIKLQNPQEPPMPLNFGGNNPLA